MRHASEHPFQTFCAILYAQFRIVSALRAFDVPRAAPPANDNQKREEPGSNQQLRNVKRDSIEEEFQISQNGTGTQGSPFGVNLRNGTNLVLWHSDRIGDSNIYGRYILLNYTYSNN